MRGTVYAVLKLKSILFLFKMENKAINIISYILGDISPDLRKQLKVEIDKKVEKIVNDIRVRQ